MGSDRWKDPGGPWTGCLNSRNLDGHQQIKLPWYSMVVVGGQGGLWHGHTSCLGLQLTHRNVMSSEET